jgi:uncharacterized protein YvpB
MTLAYLGRTDTAEQLTRLLETRSFGTPLENILRLDQIGLQVTLKESSLEEISRYLQNNRPVIAFVNTLDLPYWQNDTDHAVVIVGMDDEFVYVNDPYIAEAPQRIPRLLFELSMMRFGFRCAIIEGPKV